MVTSHTPGPWKIVEFVDDAYVWGNGVTALARVYGAEYDSENKVAESKANASLIAAAPEMLCALVQCETWVDMQGDVPVDNGLKETRQSADAMLGVIRAALGKALSRKVAQL